MGYKILTVALLLLACWFAGSYFRMRAVYKEYVVLSKGNQSLADSMIKRHEAQRDRLYIQMSDLMEQRRQDAARFIHYRDSAGRSVKRLKLIAYAETRFKPEPGTPCDSTVNLRDSIIVAQDGMLLEDSLQIRRVNITLDSVNGKYIEIKRLSAGIEDQWRDLYIGAEKKAHDIDRAWKRRRRLERIGEGAIVVGTLILVL